MLASLLVLAAGAALPAFARPRERAEPPRVEGAPAEHARELEKLLPDSGGPAAREIALSFLENKGYLEAEVEVVRSSAPLELRVRPGPLYRFGKTRFEGLRKLSARALLHDLPYGEGDPYERPRLIKAQARLFGLGLFDDIDIAVSTGASRAADVTIRVKERPLKALKMGVGYGSEERERVSATLTHENLFGRAYRGEVGALYSHIWLEYRGELVNRHFFGSDAEQRDSVTWRRENRVGYDLERAQGLASLSDALSAHWRATTQYRLSQTVIYNADPQIAADQPARPLQSGLSLSVDYDSTDDPLFPSRGVRGGLLLERQGGFLGGDVDLNRGSARAGGFWNPFWRLVGSASFSGGVVRQFAPSATVPVFERWFMGGATTVRGYRERDVGPKDSLGSPIGGNVYTRGGVEARAPLYKQVWLAAFLDGGMVDADEKLVWPARWRWGAGPGLRLRTPVGPVRLDAGWKVNPDPGLSRWVFHFSLGEVF